MSNEIITRISHEDYLNELKLLETLTVEADIFVMFSADTICRTVALKRYRDWFEERDLCATDYIAWTDIGDGMLGCVDAFSIDGPVDIVWLFDMRDPEEKALALLFKLTFGGA